MSENFNLNVVWPRLGSEDLSEQAAALDEAFTIMDAFARKVVDQWVHSNDRFIIWERLYRLGPFVMQPLKEIVSGTEDTELRTLASTVLLYLGDHIGVPILLEELSKGDNFCLVAGFVARAHIIEAGDRIIERLRALDRNPTKYITCLLSALELLGIDLPQDLSERFFAEDAPFDEISLFRKKSIPHSSGPPFFIIQASKPS